MTQQVPTREAGFTLVEMLIAVFIFSLISIGSMTALSSTLQGKTQINAHMDDIAKMESARALMKSDFANIILRHNRDAYGSPQDYLLSGGYDNLISFTRTGRVNPGGLERRGDLQRVVYILEDGQLIRRSLTQANPVPQTPSVDRVMMDGIASAKLNFTLGEETLPYVQVPATKTDLKLDYVTLTLEFENGDILVQNFEVAL